MPGQSMHPAPTRRGGKSAPVQSPQVSVLVVDNYDSFVYTLVGYLEQLGARTTVIRNDEVTPARALELAAEHTAVLISPGPGAPADAGVSLDLIRSAAPGAPPAVPDDAAAVLMLAPTAPLGASEEEALRSFLARGQLYEQLGERQKAAAAYERFVALWRDADPALQPQVRRAREALARVRDAGPAGRPVGG